MPPVELALGPAFIDVAATALTDEDRRRLLHPVAGGVVLFSRNYDAPGQLAQLTAEIHALRSPPLVIAVDHEGGRVQRFRDGFTRLPPMRALGLLWDADPARAKWLAHETGYVLAAELRAHGVDLSFTPVLDLDHGSSSVIGDRAFHSRASAVGELAGALVGGLHEGGMGAVGKHFPGHGHVRADSHLELPVDERGFAEIEKADLVPFARLIGDGVPAIMPAHVVYAHVDERPAGFSPIWLKEVLRERLGFGGLVVSDDLSMAGAAVAAGGIVERAQAALDAGCDVVLVCNDASAVDELCGRLGRSLSPVALARLARLHGRGSAPSMPELRASARYTASVEAIAGMLRGSDELPLG
jgi:beta-N-acetylhexosaminidase